MGVYNTRIDGDALTIDFDHLSYNMSNKEKG